MKQHMARKREEMEAQNAQLRQQRGHGRPVAHAPVPPPVEKAADLTDLPGVWIAARNYLAQNARLLESVLGGCSRLEALDTAAGQATLAIPNTQRNFTNDRARAKLEEALRAVTDLPLKLQVNFVEPPPEAAHDRSSSADGSFNSHGGAAAQRRRSWMPSRSNPSFRNS